MIHAGVGLSTELDTETAAGDAAQQAAASLPQGHADFVIAFATDEHAGEIPELVQAIGSVLGTPYVVGCSASGLIAAGREIEDGPAVGVLAVRSDSLRGTPFLFGDTGDNGLTAGRPRGPATGGLAGHRGRDPGLARSLRRAAGPAAARDRRDARRGAHRGRGVVGARAVDVDVPVQRRPGGDGRRLGGCGWADRSGTTSR
jgi:hypothetical protein